MLDEEKHGIILRKSQPLLAKKMAIQVRNTAFEWYFVRTTRNFKEFLLCYPNTIHFLDRAELGIRFVVQIEVDVERSKAWNNLKKKSASCGKKVAIQAKKPIFK